ncbi:MAG: beta-propeller domain-containing protein [Myxococcota bacterium]|nr:beta-propeller domain-containing protein [Myxococcota bacterium]
MGGNGEAAAGPSHHTTTNVQERGVDEADIVKTDGKHGYTVHDNELVIAKPWPFEKTDVAARVTFKTIHPQQLYLRGNEVIVQGQATDPWPAGRARAPREGASIGAYAPRSKGSRPS